MNEKIIEKIVIIFIIIKSFAVSTQDIGRREAQKKKIFANKVIFKFY